MCSQFHSERFRFPFQSYAIAWSPEGKQLATVEQIGLVNIWDVTNGKLKASLRGCSGWIKSISWTANGTRLAAGNDRRTVVIWDVPSGVKLQSLHGHTAPVGCVHWNPDGARLASGGDDGTICVWDAHTGKTLSSLLAPSGPVVALDWHPDGRQLLANSGTAGSRELRIWDTATGEEIVNWSTGWAESAAYGPDGHRVEWGMEPVRITDLKTQKVVSSFPGNATYRTAWSPSGDQLASRTGGGTIKIWNSETESEISTIPGPAWSVAWSPNERLLATADREVKVWDTAAVEQRVFSFPGRHALSAAFSPDGHRLLTGARHGLLKIWDVESGEESLTVQVGLQWLRCVAWSPDGRRFAYPAGSNVVISDAETGKRVLPLLACDDEPRSLAWSPDGKILAVGYYKSRFRKAISCVKLWDADTGEEIATSAYAEGGCDSVAWRPDGSFLAGSGKSTRVWDSTLGNEFVVAADNSLCVDWSPDGQYLAAGSARGTITIYDAEAWTPIDILEGHSGFVEALAWHPHLPRLASGARDRTIRIWDTSTGRELCALGRTHRYDRRADLES